MTHPRRAVGVASIAILIFALGVARISQSGDGTRSGGGDPSTSSVHVGGTTTTAAPTTPPDPLVPFGPPGPWKLAFTDDFSGAGLDRSRWSTCFFWDCTIQGNPEEEWYQPSQVQAGGGLLQLAAVPDWTHGEPFVSGMVSSYDNFVFRYGYFQIVARLPSGQAMWSAFWTLPENGSFPPEIDGEENWGQADAVHFFVHVPGIPQYHAEMDIPSYASAFHTYGVDWEPTFVDWYVDGVRRAHIVATITDPEYLLANLAVATTPPPAPGELFPQVFAIRSIQVWQHP